MSKLVICKSGAMGRQGRLRKNYESYTEFWNYDRAYNLHQRLGYKTPINCWRANPTIQWSVNPGDFRKAPIKTHAKKKTTSRPGGQA